MKKNELSNTYFDWMYQLVCNEKKYRRLSYRKLLLHIHNIDFFYTIAMDGNRAEDGVDLRYRFGYERHYEHPVIAACLDYKNCSVLEMLVALSIRCEEHIMDNADMGNRTGQWFWSMMHNLGLTSMTDDFYDFDYVDRIIFKFLNRQYKRNGEGGLFTIHDNNRDLRSVEIWYQLCWYINELL